MAKTHPTFACQECGAVYNRWRGRCEACGGWNCIVEEGAAAPRSGAAATRPGRARGRIFALEGLSGTSEEAPRTPCGIAEFDRVTGGGFVTGSVILLGGDPGIGKSTLLMQVTAALARRGARVVYISGEEAVAQVRLRAERLGPLRRRRRARRRDQRRGQSSRPSRRAARPRSRSSTRSRPCGPRPSIRRPAP